MNSSVKFAREEKINKIFKSDNIMGDINNEEQREEFALVIGFTEDQFLSERKKWTKRIKERSSVFGQPVLHGLAENQAYLYAERQSLLDYMHDIQREARKTVTVIRKTKKDIFHKFKEESNVKYSGKHEYDILIEGSMAKLEEYLAMLDAQIEFCRESIKIYDAMHFGIGHRIKIQELIGT